MTNSEAIKIINQYDCNFYWTDGEKIPTEDLIEAFELAVKALDATEARVLTLEEVRACSPHKEWLWLEEPACNCIDGSRGSAMICAQLMEINEWGIACALPNERYDDSIDFGFAHYNKTWRCWSSRPTDKQREAVPWTE